MGAIRRVLIIDDEPDIREVAQVCLEEMAGWTVLQAESGPEGVVLARNERPDVILLDVMMPSQDGPTTLVQLGEADGSRSIPVIFVTAKAQPAELRRLMDLGAAGVITKPFDSLRLAEEVEEIVVRFGQANG